MTSPQGILSNPQNWSHNHSSTTHISNKCNAQNQLYQCSSECSDHSLKSHSQYSYSSQDRSKNSSVSVSNSDGRSNERPNRHHNHNHQNSSNNDHLHKHKHTSQNCGCDTKNDCNVNGNIYENEEEISECEQMTSNNSIHFKSVSDVDKHSECCSSVEDGDNDTCCSCSESSCLYTETVESDHQTDTKLAA